MLGLDTNILVRYLVQDDAPQSAKVNRLIETQLSAEQPGFVAHITLCELVWVLETCYSVSRQLIADVIERLLATKQLALQQTDLVWPALALYRGSQADFADAMISTIARSQGCDKTLTFDKAAARLAGFELLA